MIATVPSERPVAASLDDPLYYLANLRTVLGWVTQHHADLLLAEERSHISTLLNLSQSAQALFARMMLRTGEVFRLDALHYEEIPSVPAAIEELADVGWVSHNPALTASDVFRLCRKDELWQLLQQHPLTAKLTPAKSASKQRLGQLLLTICSEETGLAMSSWWPSGSLRTIAQRRGELITRVRLMFFGNLYQDWSEFVLTELGYQQYEQVPFAAASKVFRRRSEVDQYLALHMGHSALAEGAPLQTLAILYDDAFDNPWLEHRREKLRFHIAREAERQGDLALALRIYNSNRLDDARVRYFRVKEKTIENSNRAAVAALLDECVTATEQVQQPEAKLHLARVQNRLISKYQKLGPDNASRSTRPPTATAVMSVPKAKNIPTERLYLNDCGNRVEWAALQALLGAPDGENVANLSEAMPESPLLGYHCENSLFNGLFGLLFWPVLFSPLPGAFFHPFQAGPADLYWPDFVDRRREQVDATLALLDTEAYKDHIRANHEQKHGLACSFVHWPLFSESVVEAALECIPPPHLRTVFEHLLSDLRRHRRGMPDLVIFDRANKHYRLVEVKGPGDRLQDHQLLWLATMLEHGLPVSVVEVRWQAQADDPATQVG